MVTPDLAAHILRRGKALAPDRFPVPDPEVTAAWAEALHREYPPELWKDAVDYWARAMVGDRMCTPRDLLAAARKVVGLWEADPRKAQVLANFRREFLHARYRVLLGDRYSPEQVPDFQVERHNPRMLEKAGREFNRRALKSRPSASPDGITQAF